MLGCKNIAMVKYMYPQSTGLWDTPGHELKLSVNYLTMIMINSHLEV